MTIDWDKPIETTDGSGGRVISRDYRGRTRKSTNVVVQIEYDGFNEIHFYTEDGSPIYSTSPRLHNKTKKVTKWYNLYADKPGLMYMDNEEMARRSTLDGKPPIATLSTEIEVPCD